MKRQIDREKNTACFDGDLDRYGPIWADMGRYGPQDDFIPEVQVPIPASIVRLMALLSESSIDMVHSQPSAPWV